MTAARTAQDINLKPRTGDVLIEENLEFRGLLLSPLIQEGLSKCGFVRPSPIQLKAIPLGRCGLDLIVQAKSGTGKTCVFSVIALEGILLDSMATQVLVLAPTREIAVQICEVVNNMGSCMPGLRCLTFIGGTPLNEDRKKLARCHIAIGTPGRIKQLIEEKLLNTSNIRLFVLDEADKLLEDSFQEQVNWIFSSLPENKQMLALSATYPEVLAQQLTAYMRNPTFLRLNITDPALLGIRQYYRTVKFNPLANKLFDSKTEALLELLSSVEFHQCLVFSNYQMRAESLSEVLNYRGWPTTYISGSREQQDRMAAMTSLKQMTCRVLISTDLTSRGIDAENVNLVVNLDLPPNHETYLHRIGRAGRFGTYGAGVSFVAEGEEMDGMHNIEKHCKTTIKPLPDPIPDDLARSSGFVCLEHLVTTETIITKKEEVNASQSKPIIASPPKPQPEAKVPNGDGPSASESNRILPEESELTDVNGNRSCEPESVDTCEEPLISGPVSGSGDPPSEVAQQSESTKIAPRRKTNNVWTNLSYSYRAESKDMEEKRGKGQLVSASANDQRKNTSPRKAASAVKHGEDKENSRNVANVVADNERIAVSDNISADEQVLLKDGDASILAATGNSVTTLPSVRGTEGCPAGHRTYTELLADYDKYIARDVCESVDPTLAVDVKTVINIKYEDYLKNISKLLQNLVEHKLQPAQLKKTEDIVPSASSKLSSVPSVPGKQLEDPPVVCATQKSKCPQIKDVKLTETPVKCAHKKLDTKKTSNDGACGKQLTSEQLMMNYAALNDNHRRPQPDAEEQNVDLGAVVIGVNLSQFTAKTTKPKMAKPKKKVSPYGPWEPYVPPTKPEVEEDEEESYEQEVDGEEFESGESDADSDWESSSLDDVGAGQGTHANHSPRRSSGKGTSRNYGQYPPYSIEQGHYPTQKEGQERDSAQSWEQAHYASYPGEQEHYPQYAKDQWHYPQPQEQPGSYPGHSGYAYYPPQPGHAYYPQQSGHGYYPPPSGYGDHCPPPWGVPSPPDLAFQNMMHAQQAMLFTTTCYHQYVMHLQQAEFYKWMLQSQHAQSNTGSLYRAQERYIRKLAKWMAKNNHK